MQAQGQPNLAGVDFNQYSNWQQVRTPSGGVYYAVPGTPYVYDPFLSAARGQPVLWQNPSQRDQEIERQRQIQDEQRRQAERASSPEGQLLPIAGTVAGTVGSAYAIRELTRDGTDAAVTGGTRAAADSVGNAGGSLTNAGTITTPQAPVAVQTPASTGEAFTSGALGQQTPTTPSSMTPVVADVQVIPPGQSVPNGYTAVGTAADGSGAQIAVPTDQVGHDGSFNLGPAAQGILGAYQLYQGYNAYQDGDYLGAGINTAAGAAMIGSALGSQTAASAAPYLGPIAGVYHAYKTDEAVGSMPQGSERNTTGAAGGAAAGAAIGSPFGPVGMAAGAVIGGLAGLALSLAGSNKDKYQMIRDKGRDHLQKQGILDENYKGTLADGSTFDFGKDGKKYGKPQFDNPLYGEAAAFGNVLATVEGLYGRPREAMAMLYGNAGVSNAGDDPNVVLDNYKHFAQQRGITLEAAAAQINKMHEEGNISEHERDVYLADARKFIPAGGEDFGRPQVAAQPELQNQVANKPAMMQTQPPAMQQRSQTRSPGIDMQGNRIDYNTMGKELARRMDRRL